MEQEAFDLLEKNPIIAAVKDEEGMQKACQEENIQIIFLLFGDICTLPELTGRIAAAGKVAVVHLDLVTGLATKEIAVDFVQKQTKASGIISTKPALVKRAKELGMLAVLRIFLVDSMALSSMERQMVQAKPDVIEILPGVMPKIIGRVSREAKVPVIAGGMILDREDVMAALKAGALCVSTTCEAIWEM